MLPEKYLRNNYTEIPLLSTNIHGQPCYQHGDKQVALIFQFFHAKKGKIKQKIPVWREADCDFCGK